MALGELVGLIPAAGRARRLGAQPCSKEVLPIGFRSTPNGPVRRVACDCLLELLRVAGAARAFVVLREDKQDVARYLGAGERCGVPIEYVSIAESASLPESLDRAYSLVRGARVALGFPDVQVEPANALARVAAHQAESGADLVLGLFPAERPQSTDMVELDAGGRVLRVEVRPRATSLRLCWVLAVWGPAFTAHLHDFVAEALRCRAAGTAGEGELQIGAVVASAVARNLDVRGVEIEAGRFHDIGTPEDLAAIRGGGDLAPPPSAP
ncbi:MAG TPA: dTDP-glucose pyrophosphorylase [Thermoanaerobaculia bacterium]|jgi:glucose-1-phosphate thymidylyltransferase|nr:dTDP-glucose pyrophosphorylase [Thermoanaerobaculia bacterium]